MHIDTVGTTSIGKRACWPSNIWAGIPYSTLSRGESVEEILVVVVIEVIVEKVDPHLEKGGRSEERVGSCLMLRTDSADLIVETKRWFVMLALPKD